MAALSEFEVVGPEPWKSIFVFFFFLIIAISFLVNRPTAKGNLRDSVM